MKMMYETPFLIVQELDLEGAFCGSQINTNVITDETHNINGSEEEDLYFESF